MGWIGVDLDRTVAKYENWQGYEHIGKPIEPILNMVKTLVKQKQEVRIFTARAYPITQPVHTKFSDDDLKHALSRPELLGAMKACNAIIDWCELHVGKRLPITCIKDYHMDTLYDDRAIQVMPNRGLVVQYVPNLEPVISWLENGNDVQEAIKELKVYQALRGSPCYNT